MDAFGGHEDGRTRGPRFDEINLMGEADMRLEVTNLMGGLWLGV